VTRHIELPARVHREARLEIRAGEGDQAVALSISSEAPVERFFGVEVLGHGAEEVDMSAVGPRGLPLLRDHRQNNIDAVLGRVVDLRVEGGKLRGSVAWGDHEEAKAVAAKVRAGTLSEISVGYSVEAMTLAEKGRDGAPDVYRVTRWTPREVSLVAVPADPSVGVGRSDTTATVRVAIAGGPDMPDNVKERAAPEIADNEATKAKAAAKPAEAARAADKEDPREIAKAAVAAEIKADRERCAALDELGAKYGVPRESIEKAKRGGLTPDQFAGVVLEHMGADAAAQRMNAATSVGLSEREASEFSFVRLMHALASQRRDLAPFEHEVCDAAAEAASRNGRKRDVKGAMVPFDVLGRAFASPMRGGLAQRNIVVGDKSDGTGGQLVETTLDAGSFIDLLRNRLLMTQLGARMLTGLEGDVAIPKHTGAATAAWLGEGDAPAESTPTFGNVVLSPHTVGAWTKYSRKLLIQSSPDIEALVRMDLVDTIRIAIDACALNGSADGDAPDGIVDTAGINAFNLASANAPTWAEVVNAETRVAVDNADVGALAYAMGPAIRGYLKSTPKVSGDATMMMTTANEVNGYRAAVSTQVPAGEFWFGNWSDLLIGMWTGIDIVVDPYTLATSGGVRVVAMQDVDFGVRNAVSFCRASGGA
jgi:HK97 family phage major capsid protein/HK97 family phage prohead protease